MTTVAIVDDNRVDRYTVKRRLKKVEEFDEILEFDAGDTFLNDFFLSPDQGAVVDELIVLMDINMPRMDGFETVAGMEQHLAKHDGIKSCVVMMYSSSDNPLDRERAEKLALVKGYIVKPFGVDDIARVKSFMQNSS